MIIHAKIIRAKEILEGYVLVFDKKIVRLCKKEDFSSLNKKIQIIDAKGAYLSAGFIDLHIHGSGGIDVMDATPLALNTLSKILPSTGTTSFLATTMTMSPQHISKALATVKNFGKEVSGAEILGVHLEGPFINPSKHGAQDKAHIQELNMALIEPYINDIKMLTLAPEMPSSQTLIEKIHQQYPHIILSIGHSQASYSQAKESFDWGISHVTHLFNAMPSYHHREPSIVGAVFDDERITCDIIADLIHTHPQALKLAQQIKKDKLLLITDAMRAGCMKCGMYDLGGKAVEVKEGKATLEDGTLAGSVLKMNEALANMCKHTDMTVIEAIYSVTLAPAQKLGINKGEIKKGFDADIVLFDENFQIVKTFVAGEEKYSR